MIQPAKPELVTVFIDGKEIAVPKGTNVIEAARMVGTDVPHYCYHPKLTVAGNCRMCLIELGMPMADRATREPIMDPETGKQKINWIPRPQIGCGTTVVPGMHVKTQSQMVKDCREGVMEFLLINHPLDCPICDQAGECKLQEQATGYGRGYSRFIEQKNVKPKRTQLGPRVMLDDERCVLCSRCIRFNQEIVKEDVLGFVDRGSYSTLTCYPGKELTNNYSLNTVDICPVGALTSTDFRFKMRVWFLKQTNSIDTESSVGANTVVWSREGVIYRITPRQNDEVNDTWMADSGRVLYKQVQADDRLKTATIGGKLASIEFALTEAANLVKTGGVTVVGSGRSSVEEQFLTKKLATTLGAETTIVARTGEDDGILISADRNPNTRGALVTGLISDVPTTDLSALGAAIDAGSVTTIVSVGEDLLAAGLTADQLSKVAVIYLGAHGNPTSAMAQVVMPTLTVFEKNGTFINQQFRLQKFAAAVPGLAGSFDDLYVLDQFIVAVGGESIGVDVKSVWPTLAAEIPALATATYANLPATGLLLDSTPWASLNFPEGKSLHFEPAVETTTA
ncbi:2Fe-2S iron-sulfur cluster-binding protein [Synoicihabitans lomoniglobus]|uniref:2Fe-2S iron-sulfur cluster-binding protein n=1 Tax=Synoicihabitans lomoniglobus TaxID=2909285 RepID=A0AAE9ZYI8_9BACT|nr:2Fe-2S iron-sulfur cluster-binding protein [Opitutaceae bacterium LMO-M01]WED64943.1 2Fe-2S iron-sulfur cluster-binding protein [Opitutaceae bacterium LMO-M01]